MIVIVIMIIILIISMFHYYSYYYCEVIFSLLDCCCNYSIAIKFCLLYLSLSYVCLFLTSIYVYIFSSHINCCSFLFWAWRSVNGRYWARSCSWTFRWSCYFVNWNSKTDPNGLTSDTRPNVNSEGIEFVAAFDSFLWLIFFYHYYYYYYFYYYIIYLL